MLHVYAYRRRNLNGRRFVAMRIAAKREAIQSVGPVPFVIAAVVRPSGHDEATPLKVRNGHCLLARPSESRLADRSLPGPDEMVPDRSRLAIDFVRQRATFPECLYSRALPVFDRIRD